VTQPKTPSSSPDRIFAPRKSKGYDLSVAATAPRTASEACRFAMLWGGAAGLCRGAASGAPAARRARGSSPGYRQGCPPPKPQLIPRGCAAGTEVCALLRSRSPGWVSGQESLGVVFGGHYSRCVPSGWQWVRGAFLLASRKGPGGYPGASPTPAPRQPGMCWLCPAEHLLLWKTGAPLQGTGAGQLGTSRASPGEGETSRSSFTISTPPWVVRLQEGTAGPPGSV